MGLRSWISEMWPVRYVPASVVKSGSALRGLFSEAFRGVPNLHETTVDFDLARSLYRNDNPDYKMGAGFVRPIIDLTVEYVGLPSVTSDDAAQTTWLNECLHNHWAPDILQVWRDSLRDSKTIFRFRQPRTDNPLFTEEDRMHGRVEIIPPEMVELSFNPADPDLLDQAVVHHEVEFDKRTDEEIIEGHSPRMETHHVLEVITRDQFLFYDKTEERRLDTWTTRNALGFVPLWPAYNEYSAELGGGQSDIEPVLPFITAFHDVMLQSLSAHAYHSDPKAKFKLKDVTSFLINNFPEVLDDDKRVKPGSKVNWSGRQVFFMESEEDLDYVEVTSVLGDSKTLLEFLVDCIAIAGEVPRWALLKDQGATDKDASVQPFEKKIARKRTMFMPLVQMMCKMALVAKGANPITVKVTWPTLRLTDLAAKAQASQQLVMALDTAKINRWVADATAIEILAGLFPEINDPETEMKLAEKNYEPPDPAAAPASATQGAQVTRTTSTNGNGGGSKATATRAVRKAVTS